MIDKKFIDYIGSKLRIEKKDLIEKDTLLQMLLNELVKHSYFKDNFAFKGGTCLIKNYLGYFRFSEDLDFTYINKGGFIGKSNKNIRKSISEKVDKIGELIEAISHQLSLDFKKEKENSNYFHFGGSNAFVTFKIGYDSVILNKHYFIKLQINFIEKLIYEPKELLAVFILDNKDKEEIELLFNDYSYLLNPIKIKVYDLREILVEKVRAILTRRGIKARDFVDVFLITNKEKLDINNFKKEIKEKINATLKFEKYTEHIKNKETQLKDDIILEGEEALMLVPIGRGFPKFVKEFNIFLKEMAKELNL